MKTHRHVPTITDTISLLFITEVAISPGGEYVAYVVRTADWGTNEYVLTCFLHNVHRNNTRKIAENTWQPRWLNDNTLAVLHCEAKETGRYDKKSQIWLFYTADSCGVQITFAPYGVDRFWCFGSGIIYLADSDPSNQAVEREKWYGSYVHVGQEPRTAQLFYTDPPNPSTCDEASRDLHSPDSQKALRLTDGLDPSLRIRDLCPSTNTLYLNCQFQHDPDAISVWRISISPTELGQIAAAEVTETVEFLWEQLDLPSNAAVMDVAPDGTLLLNWNEGRSEFFSNEPWALWTCSPASGRSISDLRCVTTHFESQVLAARWHAQDIYLHYIDRTISRLARLDATSRLEVYDFGDIYPLCSVPNCFDISEAGILAFVAGGPNSVPEVAVVPKSECLPTQSSSTQTASQRIQTQKITTFNALCEDWDWGTRETITGKAAMAQKSKGAIQTYRL